MVTLVNVSFSWMDQSRLPVKKRLSPMDKGIFHGHVQCGSAEYSKLVSRSDQIPHPRAGNMDGMVIYQLAPPHETPMIRFIRVAVLSPPQSIVEGRR